MWKQFFREYCRFSRRERNGVLLLLLLILMVWGGAFFFSPAAAPPADFSAFKKEIDAWVQTPAENLPSRQANQDRLSAMSPPVVPALFYFDPNTLTATGWQRLGLQGRTIRTIQHYLARGGHFRQPADLGRIYGLRREEYERLVPYVRIENKKFPAWDSLRAVSGKSGPSFGPFASVSSSPRPFLLIDINTADTTQLILLRGIGSKLAQRIVHFREKLGGFYAIEQLAEVYGLSDSVFRQIKSHLNISAVGLRKINVNTADIKSLQQHPYIRYNLANVIVQYRQQHGPFRRLEELKQLALVDEEIYHKLVPYLEVNP